jgi:hypothetical protein
MKKRSRDFLRDRQVNTTMAPLSGRPPLPPPVLDFNSGGDRACNAAARKDRPPL